MKKIFLQDGSMVRVTEYDEKMVLEALEPAIYTVKHSPMIGYYLQRIANKFDLPKKLYGSIHKRSDKIIHTYTHNDDSTAVMATGNKGMGKTELMKLTANKMIINGVPVIKVEEFFSGSDFISFIESLGESMLLFDEFAKTYKSTNENENRDEGQEGLLSLFDGMSNGKRLCFITENRKYDINQLFIDRPGRVWYHFEYKVLEHKVIKQYAKDLKMPKKAIKDLVNYASTVDLFSMDTLKAICKEYTVFKTPIAGLVEDLNVPNASDFNRNSILKVIKHDVNDPRFKWHKNTTVEYDEQNEKVFIKNLIRTNERESDFDDGAPSLVKTGSSKEEFINFAYDKDEGIAFYDGKTLIIDSAYHGIKVHCERQFTPTTNQIKSLDSILNSF